VPFSIDPSVVEPEQKDRRGFEDVGEIQRTESRCPAIADGIRSLVEKRASLAPQKANIGRDGVIDSRRDSIVDCPIDREPGIAQPGPPFPESGSIKTKSGIRKGNVEYRGFNGQDIAKTVQAIVWEIFEGGSAADNNDGSVSRLFNLEEPDWHLSISQVRPQRRALSCPCQFFCRPW